MVSPDAIAQQMVDEARVVYNSKRSNRHFWGEVSRVVLRRKFDQPTAYQVAKSLEQLGYDGAGKTIGPVFSELSPDTPLAALLERIAFCLCTWTCADFDL